MYSTAIFRGRFCTFDRGLLLIDHEYWGSRECSIPAASAVKFTEGITSALFPRFRLVRSPLDPSVRHFSVQF